MQINNIQKAHFIGIGGIGMSALARMLVHRGVVVSGSDSSESELTKVLEGEGINIVYKQVAENIKADIDLVVYTDAMPQDHAELVAAREAGITTMSYFEALGEAAKEYKVIAIAGTHGKTTTAAMTAQAMISAGLDPTVIVGSIVDWEDGSKSNFRAGQSEYLLVEACEYKRHFLQFSPHILAVTNIELDHPDYYKDLRDVEDAFAELASKSEIVLAESSIQKYMLRVPELRVPGEYNKENAALALAICDELGADMEKAKSALQDFTGTWRRFDYKGVTKSGARVYDDYAHHPTAIKAMLKGVRVMIDAKPRKASQRGKIIVVFEPHTYTRTAELMGDFAQSFADADEVIIAPIYAAREESIDGVTAEALAQRVAMYRNSDTVQFTKTLGEAITKANELGQKGDIIIFMGAGNLYSLVPKILI